MNERPTSERGFTLIELMISVVLSAVLIAFVFQIHGQMAGAMRGQAAVSEVAETVSGAREMISRELRSAGIGFPASGVVFGTGANQYHYGIVARNDANGGADADVVDFLEIQRTRGATAECDIDKTTDPLAWVFTLRGAAPTFDEWPEFNGTFPLHELMIANGSRTTACVITWAAPSLVTPTALVIDSTFFTNGGHCEAMFAGLTQATVTVFERIAFRLDPDPATYELGVLQRFDGFGAWQSIGVGFTNFQVAVRYFEVGDNTDADGDGDGERDWYSGTAMEPFHVGRPASDVVLQVGFSIEGRNTRRMEAVSSSATPGYVDAPADYVDNNPLGNWGGECPGKQYDPCGISDLAATTHPRYSFPGRVYRSSSTTVWLRNRLGQL